MVTLSGCRTSAVRLAGQRCCAVAILRRISAGPVQDAECLPVNDDFTGPPRVPYYAIIKYSITRTKYSGHYLQRQYYLLYIPSIIRDRQYPPANIPSITRLRQYEHRKIRTRYFYRPLLKSISAIPGLAILGGPLDVSVPLTISGTFFPVPCQSGFAKKYQSAKFQS